MTQIVQR